MKSVGVTHNTSGLPKITIVSSLILISLSFMVMVSAKDWIELLLVSKATKMLSPGSKNTMTRTRRNPFSPMTKNLVPLVNIFGVEVILASTSTQNSSLSSGLRRSNSENGLLMKISRNSMMI